jgi:IS30 family transposase
MSEMSIYRAGGLSRHRRTVSRELDRLEARGQIQTAAIEQQADLQVARVQAIGYVGKHAMHEVALLSQLEHQLAALIPSAAGRLQGLDDIAALAMADVLSDTVRRVR